MRHLSFAAALVLASCSQVADAPMSNTPDTASNVGGGSAQSAQPDDATLASGYNSDWHISDGWAGEWPSSFVVEGEDVIVLAQSTMDRMAKYDVRCEMPSGANYHPWNSERYEADDLNFKTANRMSQITMTADADIVGGWSVDDTPLSLKAGDTLTYKHYIAEGWFLAEYKGADYELEESMFLDIADFSGPIETDQWVNVQCEDGARAWIQYKDAIAVSGIAEGEATEFGFAKDRS